MLSLSEILLPVVAVLLIVAPIALVFSGRMNPKNAKQKMIAQIWQKHWKRLSHYQIWNCWIKWQRKK